MRRNLFKKTDVFLNEGVMFRERKTPEIPKGMWRQCKKCGAAVYAGDVKNHFYTCPKCGGYFRVHAYRRIEMIADAGSFEEWDQEMEFVNPIGFANYEEKSAEARALTGLNEAIVTGKCRISGIPAAVGACDARYLMSSMGHNFGEKVTRAAERAAEEKLPLILFACSGGARMQEGIVSLMQMAKTAAALLKLREAGQLFISVLTDPTMGGVTASFAMLGDIILAEPKALIGFAGPRVIAQTIGARLPEGFQRSEFLLEHGFLDRIVERREEKEVLTEILRLHAPERNYHFASSVFEKEKTGVEASDAAYVPLKGTGAWDTVMLSRDKKRATARDYMAALFPDFMEFHGDRYFGDDGAVIGGIADFHGVPVTVIGQQKGRSVRENETMNYGMPKPEGYRKALRLMKEADAFGRPVICIVDTPGAFCGLDAEERGQGQAIAENLQAMAGLKVPVLSLIIGEGGSGGALGMAVANEVWIMEHAVYSILSPEGFAAILYKDAKKCREAAEEMKITAAELKNLGIVEELIPEPENAETGNLSEIGKELDRRIMDFLFRFAAFSGEELKAQRYKRFRKF